MRGSYLLLGRRHGHFDGNHEGVEDSTFCCQLGLKPLASRNKHYPTRPDMADAAGIDVQISEAEVACPSSVSLVIVLPRS